MVRQFLLMVLIFWSGNIYAYNCIGLEKLSTSEIEEAKAIFIGEIIDVVEHPESYSKSAKIVVLDRLKSDNSADTLIVNTSIGGASCGLDFTIGETWYIFAWDYKGTLKAGLCGRSAQLKRKFKISDFGFRSWRNSRKANRRKMRRVREEIKLINKTLN